ncbi:hypothetical protein BBR47_35170 [Brevibacillus brevis NBRC 100599]|uniref:Uncharacterized protein n=1 Tax=Brevibacillus brevis (strain 47 / JCM 6285 / NBRC 100599) TaxID=358681 RepID=C0ZFD5_BREBN|nr:hypothetical protein [Brevibacillus brevis]BAH44494.1 hypothetical protein BBR47_35170 [Brevibacillus brevis NBRC 100599]
MKKVTFDCDTGETVELDMTKEEIAELDQNASTPPTLTQEELLLLALTDTQMRLAEQQALTDQLALAISQIQIGGAPE